MGRYNSSIYRVRPLMAYLERDEAATATLLSLLGIAPQGRPTVWRYDGAPRGEMKLKPTKRHLLALIRYMANKEHGAVAVRGQKRRALFFGSPEERAAAAARAEAELEAAYDTLTAADRPWYLFEGFTCPDIYLEGEGYVIVCEGKWTEPHITTTTTHLSAPGEYRNQMIRHIQGALNHTGKRVYAFYIVDAACGYTEELTAASFARQLERETVRLDKEEKEAISESFFGFTTWQDIQRVLPQILFQDKHSIP